MPAEHFEDVIDRKICCYGSFECLTAIYVRGCTLEKFSLGNLASLKYLDIRSSSISKVRLHNLDRMRTFGCAAQIENLSLERGRFSDLESFTLTGSQVKYLTIDAKLGKLEYLGITSGNVSHVRIKKGALSRVMHLNANNESLESFEVEQGALLNIRTLQLKNNKLDSFKIAHILPKLDTLEIKASRLTEFEIAECPELEVLDLSNNLLTRFSLKGHFPELRKLFLGNNKLTKVELGEFRADNIYKFDLSNNPNLSVLDFQLRRDPANFYLRLSNTNVKFVDKSLVDRVHDAKVEVRAHQFGTLQAVVECFHKGNPLADEITWEIME